MRRLMPLLAVFALLLAGIGCESRSAPEPPEDPDLNAEPGPGVDPRPADPSAASDEERAARYQAVVDFEMPTADPEEMSDAESRQQFQQEVEEAVERQTELAARFVEDFPDDERAQQVRELRWQRLAAIGDLETVERETLEAGEHEDDQVAAEALFYHVQVKAVTSNWDTEAVLAAIDRFAERAPEDERVPQLLQVVASRQRDPDRRMEILDRVIDEYPESNAAASALGERRRLEAVGEPFELEFTDAISGESIDIQDDYEGQVVVVDFWATWCGPCIASMPELKELNDQYGDRVQFVGVSLDAPEEDGGLDKLRQFVENNEIPWPQYYQGNSWESEFSRSWGINAIPAMFVVGPDGNLVSTEAHGKLPALLRELAGEPDAAQPADDEPSEEQPGDDEPGDDEPGEEQPAAEPAADAGDVEEVTEPQATSP